MDSVDVTPNELENTTENIKPSVKPSEFKGEKNKQVIFAIEGYQGEFKVTTKAKDVVINTYPEYGVFVLEPVNSSKKFQIEVNLIGIKEKIIVPIELENKAIPILNIKGEEEKCGDYSIAYGPIEFTIDNVDYESTKGLPEVSIDGKYILEHVDGVYSVSPEDFSKNIDICIAGGYDKDGAKLVHFIHGIVFRSRVREVDATIQQFPIRATVGGQPQAEFRIDGIKLNTDDEELTPNWLHYGPMKGNTITIRTYINLNIGGVMYIDTINQGTNIRGGYADADGPNGVVYNGGYYPGGASHNYSVKTDWDNTKDSIIKYFMGFNYRKGWNYPSLSANVEFDLKNMGIELVPYAPPVDFNLDNIKTYEDKIIDQSDTTTPVERKLGNVIYTRTLKTKVINGDIDLKVISIDNSSCNITIVPNKPDANNNFVQGKIEIKSKGNNTLTRDVVLCPELVIDDQNPPIIFNDTDNPKGVVSEHPIKPHFGVWKNGMSYPKATLLEGDATLTFRDGGSTGKQAVLTGGDEPINKFKLEGYWYNLPLDMDACYKLPRIITVTGEQDKDDFYILDKRDKNKQKLQVSCLDGPTLKAEITKGRAKCSLKSTGKDKFGRDLFDLNLAYNGSDEIEVKLTCNEHPDVIIKVKYKAILDIVTDENIYTFVKDSTGPIEHKIHVYDVVGDTLTATLLEGDLDFEIEENLTDNEDGTWTLKVSRSTQDANKLLLESEGNNPKEIFVFFIEAPSPDKEDLVVVSHANGKEVIGDTINLQIVKPDDVTVLKNLTITSPSPRCHLKVNGKDVDASTNEAEGKDPLNTHVVFNADGYNTKIVEVNWGEIKPLDPTPNPNPDPDDGNTGGGTGGGNGSTGGGGNTGGVTPPTGPTEGIRPPIIGAEGIYKTTVSNECIHVMEGKPEDIKSVRVYGENMGYYFTQVDGKDVIRFYLYGGNPAKGKVVITNKDNTIKEFDIEFIYDGTINYDLSSKLANLEEEITIDVELITGEGNPDTLVYLGAEDIYQPDSLSIKRDPVNLNRLIVTTDKPGVYHILLYKYGYIPVYVEPIIFTKDIAHIEMPDFTNYVGEEVPVKIKGTNPQDATLYLLKGKPMELIPNENDPTEYTLVSEGRSKDKLVISMPGGYTAEYSVESKVPTEVVLTTDKDDNIFYVSQYAYLSLPDGIEPEDLVLDNNTVEARLLDPKTLLLKTRYPGTCKVSLKKRGYTATPITITWKDDQVPEITIDNKKPVYRPDEYVEITVTGLETNFEVSCYHRATKTKAEVVDVGSGKYNIKGELKGTYVISVSGYCAITTEAYFFVEPEEKPVTPDDTQDDQDPNQSTRSTDTEEGIDSQELEDQELDEQSESAEENSTEDVEENQGEEQPSDVTEEPIEETPNEEVSEESTEVTKEPKE